MLHGRRPWIPGLRAFRAAVSELKVTHRNSYIAHVKTLAEVTPRIVDDPVRFEEPASMAVNLLDAIRAARSDTISKSAAASRLTFEKN